MNASFTRKYLKRNGRRKDQAGVLIARISSNCPAIKRVPEVDSCEYLEPRKSCEGPDHNPEVT